ncbi:MAG: alkyldihydroxyacetonephosphate synthase [Cryptosporangiaceae bacterium]|nr:alkyldihydroxyacetonephosphate synthase [Cryptosporangiaceae bacterium]
MPIGPLPPRDMDPLGWGEPSRRTPLPPHAKRWLHREIGLPDRRPVPADPPPAPNPPPSRIPAEARAALAEHAEVSEDPATLLRHAGGKSYLDLTRRRRGESDLPDAVVTPPDHVAVLAILGVCAEHDIAVVPFGGGTSVVGGVAPLRGPHAAVIALDLRRIADLTHVDPESLTITAGAGMRGPELERALAPYGLTLGHYPQSWEYATLGGYAATRSAGQASTGYGRFDDMVVSVQLATPKGTLVAGRAPASSTGPDLRGLILGSEGVFGVITELTLRVRPIPEATYDEGWSFRTFEAGLTALRRLTQAGLAPDITRLSDPDETRATLALSGNGKTRILRGLLSARGRSGGCLLILGWEGERTMVRDRRAAATAILRAADGARLGSTVGEAWRRGRFETAYLRDELLDAGAMVETLETATAWADVPGLYDAVRTALLTELRTGDARPLLMGHVSHIYPTGASLYVTAGASRDTGDPLGQWIRAKSRATEVIAAARAVISHHHAVGTDHLPWITEEIGPLGVRILRAIKNELDPDGILNPGKLIPAEEKPGHSE